MTRRVMIETGSRLHMGLLAHRPQAGANFGGIGLMIDSPGVCLTATEHTHPEIDAPAAIRERVTKVLKHYQQHASEEIPPLRFEFSQVIPSHQGLGSGTQLSLAVGAAIAGVMEDSVPDSVTLAQRVGRGARSALGIHGFDQGGFLVDGGKKDVSEIGACVARLDWPEDWRIVLVTPPASEGLSGAEEQSAFGTLAGMPEELTNRLCRLVLMEILPAIQTRNFTATSDGIYAYGQLVGEYFAPVQGGLFASPRMAELSGIFRAAGYSGVGQSSWGPTMFAITPNSDVAENLVASVRNQRWSDCSFRVVAPRNHGATVRVETSATQVT